MAREEEHGSAVGMGSTLGKSAVCLNDCGFSLSPCLHKLTLPLFFSCLLGFCLNAAFGLCQTPCNQQESTKTRGDTILWPLCLLLSTN